MISIFSLPDSVTVSGRSCPIRTDFRTVLEVLVMLRDPDLTDADRTEALLRMMYPGRPPDSEAAISAALDFISPHRQTASGPRNLVDWERDFPLMAAPVNHILGFECRSAPYLHWHSFLAAYWEIGPESLFGRVVRIREKLKTGQKLEKWERLFLKKNRSLVILPSRLSSAEQEILKEWV
ncbi:MAG: Gp15 family bacteriophage protein [Oscillospiraceae bacterium]|nr:Gp15 family bacteriophage protein [Oscillospiraceae bacterium]